VKSTKCTNEFLIEKIFEEDKILLAYSACDGFIAGAMPVKKCVIIECYRSFLNEDIA